jgi:nicotinamide riboside kinase
MRRVSLYGGAGCGKSTLAAKIFYDLKIAGVNAELVQEYVKEWAITGREITPFDQLTIFANQLRREEVLLRNGVEVVITDSPVYLPIYYSKLYGFREYSSLATVAKWFDETYESLNIFLNRKGIEYKQEGRYEDYEQALENDKKIISMLEEFEIPYVEMEAQDGDGISNLIRERLYGETQGLPLHGVGGGNS